jgi:hypothetical protein
LFHRVRLDDVAAIVDSIEVADADHFRAFDHGDL